MIELVEEGGLVGISVGLGRIFIVVAVCILTLLVPMNLLRMDSVRSRGAVVSEEILDRFAYFGRATGPFFLCLGLRSPYKARYDVF